MLTATTNTPPLLVCGLESLGMFWYSSHYQTGYQTIQRQLWHTNSYQLQNTDGCWHTNHDTFLPKSYQPDTALSTSIGFGIPTANMHDLGVPTHTKSLQENGVLVDQSWTEYQDPYQAPIPNLASFTNCIPGPATRGLECQTLKHTKKLGGALVDSWPTESRTVGDC